MSAALITPTEFVVLNKCRMLLEFFESEQPYSFKPDVEKSYIDVAPQDVNPVDIAYIGNMIYMLGFFSDCVYKYDIEKMEYTGEYMTVKPISNQISIRNDMIVVIDDCGNIFHYELF